MFLPSSGCDVLFWLVPYDHFRLRTRLTPEEVRARLAPHVASSFWLGRASEGKRYVGRVQGDQFHLRGRSGSLTPMPPQIRGILTADSLVTTIDLRMRPWFLWSAGMVWAVGIPVWLGLDVLIAHFTTAAPLGQACDLWALGGFFYVLMTLWFKVTVMVERNFFAALVADG